MRSRILPGFLLMLALAPAAIAAGFGATSLDRILPEIRRHTPGTFYDAQGPFPGPDGQARYRIKWMTPDGRIIWFDADARSGRVLGIVGGGYDERQDRRPNFDGRDEPEQDRRSHQNFRNDGDTPNPYDNPFRGGRGNGNRGHDNGHGNGGRDRGGHDRHGGG